MKKVTYELANKIIYRIRDLDDYQVKSVSSDRVEFSSRGKQFILKKSFVFSGKGYQYTLLIDDSGTEIMVYPYQGVRESFLEDNENNEFHKILDQLWSVLSGADLEARKALGDDFFD